MFGIFSAEERVRDERQNGVGRSGGGPSMSRYTQLIFVQKIKLQIKLCDVV